MLSSFTIDQFKSYKQAATLDLAPLTTLIGANASGKSNALEALRLLSWIAKGNRLGTIAHAVQGDSRTIRGTVADLGYLQKREFGLACKTTHPQWGTYSIRLARYGDDDLCIAAEKLTNADQTPLFEVVEAGKGNGEIRVSYNSFTRGRRPRIACNNQMSVLVQLESAAPLASHHKASRREIPPVASQYLSWLSNTAFLDPRPSLMRGYSFKTDRQLDASGSNLSGVLYRLCRKASRKRTLLDLVKSLPEQNIEDIGFIETPRNEALVTLTETFGGRQAVYDATLLSDGTLRVLAIGAALLNAPRGSLVVVEEIDNGVHPSRAGALLDHVSAIATARHLRVIISSHNPALLDAIPDAAVPNVVFCHRDEKTGASQLTRLADVPAYPELIAQAPIGRLMTRGIIDRFVKRMPDPATRKRQALAWLAQIRNESG